ncbi:MAG TPA: glycosyltransferase family 87 protein [Pyrinomonadaceae bacterium]|jgi:alpha-1,2-mannosyltransferase|nr:glycosyltransferase family 87 protein [Pyrinomonadaceae bacterium]
MKWAVACLFALLYVPFLWQHGYLQAGRGVGDFPSIYWGARLAFVGHTSPYAGGAFAEAEAALDQRVFPYLYPPSSLLAFYPFSLVTYDVAKLILLITSHACFLLVLYLFFFRIRAVELDSPSRGLAAALLVAYVLNFYPVVDNFVWGQINLVVLALVCVSWLALKRGWNAFAVALPLSLAVLLKTYPVLLLPLLLIRKRFGAAALLVALVAAYAFASWLILPRGLWADWAANVAPTGGYGQQPFNLFFPVEPWNHSINGFGCFIQDRLPTLFGLPSRYLTTPLTYALCAFVGLATVGLSFLSARRGRAAKTLDLEFATYLQMTFLVAPLSWEHHLVYVLPSALMAIGMLVGGGARARVLLPVLASLFVLAWDLPRDDMFLLGGVLSLTNAIKFFAVFVMWAFCAWRLRGALRVGAGPGASAGRAQAAAVAA